MLGTNVDPPNASTSLVERTAWPMRKEVAVSELTSSATSSGAAAAAASPKVPFKLERKISLIELKKEKKEDVPTKCSLLLPSSSLSRDREVGVPTSFFFHHDRGEDFLKGEGDRGGKSPFCPNTAFKKSSQRAVTDEGLSPHHLTPRYLAATQTTPFNMNRFVLLLIYVIYTFFTARTYFGWPNLSSMLFKDGAYAWLCDGDEQHDKGDRRYLCANQDSVVQTFFLVGSATAFVFSLFAGTLLDYKGPKITASVGQACSTLGWVLLAFSGETFQSYYPAFVFMGIGSDMGFLPTMNIAYLFPRNEALVVAINAAALSASFAIPAILEDAWIRWEPTATFRKICLGYAGFGSGTSFIVALLCFPRKSFKSEDAFRKDEVIVTCNDELHNTGRRQHDDDDDNKLQQHPTTNDLALLEEVHSKQDTSTVSSDHIKDGDHINNTAFTFQKDNPVSGKNIQEDHAVRRRSSVYSVTLQRDEVVIKSTELTANRRDSKSDKMIPLDIPKIKSRNLGFRDQILTLHFLLIYMYWPINCVFYNFYVTSAENMFGTKLNDFLGKLIPLSFIPSMIIGKAADIWGVMVILCFISFTAVVMYSLAIPNVTTTSNYVSIVFSVLYVSMFSGQMYAFVSDTFEAKHFGKIVGIISITGGLLGLLRIPLHDELAVKVLHKQYGYACIIMLGLVLIACICCIGLVFIKRKRNKAY